MTLQFLTELQRDVIQRMRRAGYHGLTDCAHDAWTKGEACRLPNRINPREQALYADYEIANEEATVERR